jgi:hypothetical protein
VKRRDRKKNWKEEINGWIIDVKLVTGTSVIKDFDNNASRSF